VQNLLNMLQVFHPSLVVDEDVIQIQHHKRIGEIPQYIIHHPHESSWGIFQTKGHDQPLEKTFFGFEGSFPYICLLYWAPMVSRLQINITEVFFPFNLVKEIFDLGNQVLVPDYDFI
jgi:hypothetical protein